MGATIDELEIEISTNAANASRSITSFTNKLANLQKSVNAIDVSKLNQLASALNNVAGSMNNISTVTNNMSRVTVTINNVTRNVTRMNNTTRATNGFWGSLHGGAKKSTSLFGNLTAAIGRFYATWFFAIRGIKKLASAIKYSMDYVETLNYFNAALEQVTKRAEDEWEEAGYNSAEEYAKSFSERARQLTAEMTGYQIDDRGNYSEISGASLGLNLQDTIKYQAQFSQMASSMGVSSENALKLSEVMVKLGSDLASVKNIDFTEAWGKLSSGLVGMSRTVDSFGVNIRNANLQAKLFELGIDANISKLGQQDKALLRTIVMLDSTDYAWTDLIDTLNQPANQLRLIQNNFKMLSQNIGSLFLPVVQKLLPYINGLVIALQRLTTWVGSLLGVDFGDFMGNKGTDNSWMEDLVDDADDLAEGLGDGAKNAKKMKQQLLGIDELNNLTSKNDSSSNSSNNSVIGLEDAFNKSAEKYLAAWDEAYSHLEDRAKELANKFEKLFKPVKKLIKDISDGDWRSVGEDVSKIFTGVFDWLSKELEEVDWFEIGNNIGRFLDGIEWINVIKSVGNFFGKIFDAAIKVWVGSFNKAPLETAFITVFSLLSFTPLGAIVGKKLSAAILPGISAGFTTALASVGGFSGLMTMPIGTIIGAGTFAEIGLAIGTAIIGGIIAAVAGWNLGNYLYEKITGEDVTGTFSEQMGEIFGAIWDGTWKDAFELWWSDIEESLLILADWEDDAKENFDKFCIDIGAAASGLFVDIVQWVEDAFNNVIDFINDFILEFDKFLEGIGKKLNPFLGFLEKDKIEIDTTKITLDKIKAYANGGFVEDGLFMANHNELIGGFQGKTAVANNQQITEGIARAVRDANAENNALMREQNDILLGILQKTGITDREIYDSVRRTNSMMKMAKGISLA